MKGLNTMMEKSKITKDQRHLVAAILDSWSETFNDGTWSEARAGQKIRGIAGRIERGTWNKKDHDAACFQLDQKFQEDADYDNDAERAAVDAFFSV
jgi:hypothetical protein